MDDVVRKAKRPRPRREPAPTTPDPIEIAMEAEASGRGATGQASLLLADHRRLIRWQIASERAGYMLKVLTGVAGLAAAGALALLMWQASQADGVLLEPFAVSPALAAEGVSGDVVASHVLDELARLRAQTVSPTAERSYTTDWGHEIKVAIPATGVSLSELQAVLRQWLGHETRITGEVYRAPGGVAIRARLPGSPGLKVEGAAAELEPLAQALAQKVYGETQPVRYAQWLTDQGRAIEAVPILQQIVQSDAPVGERVEAYQVWSRARNSLGDAQGAIDLARKALVLAPSRSQLARSVAANESNLGHWEAAILGNAQGERLAPRDRALPKVWRDGSTFRTQRAILLNSYAEALEQAAVTGANPALARSLGAQLDKDIAMTMARLHDVTGAESRVASPQFSQPWRGDLDQQQLIQPRLTARVFLEDWPGLLALEPEYLRLPQRYADRSHNPDFAIFGLALAKMGDAKGAAEILDVLAADSDICMVIKARAMAALGDVAGADRLLAEVERRAPSVASPPFYRGAIRLEAGDAAGALPALREAIRRQPLWADPFKVQGDALARLGQWKEAEGAYAKAAPLAPRWGGLQLEWGEALAKTGKTAEARAKWRAASGMDLTASEQAELARHLKGGA